MSTNQARAYGAVRDGSTVPDCSTKGLRVRVTAVLSGMGNSSSVLLVRNIGPTACHLMGYPTVQMHNSMGQEAAALQTPRGNAGGLPAGAPTPSLALHDDDVASAVIEGADFPIGATTVCPSYTSLTVTLPGQPTSITVDHQIDVCSAAEVHPFVLGFNGAFPTGEVSGTAPKCKSIGYVVQISAFSGADLVAGVGIFPGRSAARTYQLVVKPGRYRIRSDHDPSSRDVEVRAGQVAHIGRYDACTTTEIKSVAPNPPAPTTSLPPSG
jgi:hypothetical protein